MHIESTVREASWSRFTQAESVLSADFLDVLVDRLEAKGAAIWDGATQSLSSSVGSLNDAMDFASAIESTLAEDQGQIETLSEGEYRIYYPVKVRKCNRAVLIVHLTDVSEQRFVSIMREVQWSIAWVSLIYATDDIETLERRNDARDSMAKAMLAFADDSSLDDAMRRIGSSLSHVFNAERVFIAFLKNKKPRVSFTSGIPLPKQRTEQVQRVESTMQEVLDYNKSIGYPNLSDNRQAFAAKALVDAESTSSVISAPIRGNDGEILGVITIESNKDRTFSDYDFERLDAFGITLGPLYALRTANEKSLIDIAKKRFDTIYYEATKGKDRDKRAKRSAIAFAALLAIYVLLIHPFDYRVSGKATVKPSEVLVVTAPYDGYIETNHVRPGDVVKQNDLLIEFEDQELQLEKVGRAAEIEKIQASFQLALGEFDRSQQRSLEAELEVMQTELELIDYQLSRSKITAPYDAIVIEGDLLGRDGLPVKTGDTLFTLAPLNEYRVAIQLNEAYAGQLKVGATGTLYLNAYPNKDWSLTIDRVIPNTMVTEGKSVFIVEGLVSVKQGDIKPGLKGVARLVIGEQSFLASFTDTWRLWFRNLLWKYFG